MAGLNLDPNGRVDGNMYPDLRGVLYSEVYSYFNRDVPLNVCHVFIKSNKTLCYIMIIPYVMQDISEMASSIYIPRGVNVKSLSTTISWPFKPNKTLKVMCTCVDHLILYLAT